MVMAVVVAERKDADVREDVGDRGEELLAEGHDGLQANHDAAGEEQAGDAEGAKGLDLAVARGEARGGGFEGVGDCGECGDVGDEVGEGVDGVGGQAVEFGSVRAHLSSLTEGGDKLTPVN